MRLIDTDKTYEVLAEYYGHTEWWQDNALEEALKKVPTADAVPKDYIVSWLICNVFDAELGRMYANKMIADWKYRQEMADWRKKNGKAD